MNRHQRFQRMLRRIQDGSGRLTRQIRRSKRPSRPSVETLETRVLLASVTVQTGKTDFQVIGASQFGPGNGVISGQAFLGTDFATPRWGVDAYADIPFFGRTGVGANFQLRGKAGFDVGYYVNSGAVDVTYDDVVLVQTYDDPESPAADFGMNAVNLSFAGNNANSGQSYFSTSAPTLGAYADLILQAETLGSVTGMIAGRGVSASLNQELLDIRQELLSFNRDNSNAIKVLGMNLPNDPLSKNWEASIPVGNAEIVLNAALDLSGL